MNRSSLATFFDRRGPAPEPDDGGLAITRDGHTLHVASAEVTASVRYLLARIAHHDVAGLPSRLGFTSALRGEGVTYVARTLGAVVAHDLRWSVCVVDLNWWVDRTGFDDDSDQLGIADVVRGEAMLDDVILETDDPALRLVPAGRVPLASRSTLAGDPVLDRLIDELAARFDHLLIELPAVLETSDALSLVRVCDAHVMVVHQGVTTEKHVRSALDEMSGAVSVGVVLNRNSSRIPRRLARVLSL